MERVDQRAGGDLLELGDRDEPTVELDQHHAAHQRDVEVPAQRGGAGRRGLRSCERDVRSYRGAGAIRGDEADMVERVRDQPAHRRRHGVAREVRADGLRRRRLGVGQGTGAPVLRI